MSMMHYSKTEAFRFVYSLLLIFLFLLVAVAYFFVYRHLISQSDQSVTALTEPSISANSTLLLREDLARFLDVYFNQTDLTGEDKQRFVLAEYLRFAQYAAAADADQPPLARFVSVVEDVVAKYEAGEADFSVEEQLLAGIYQEVK